VSTSAEACDRSSNWFTPPHALALDGCCLLPVFDHLRLHVRPTRRATGADEALGGIKAATYNRHRFITVQIRRGGTVKADAADK